MSRLPAVTAREMVRALKRTGFVEHHQKGGHQYLWHPERRIAGGWQKRHGVTGQELAAKLGCGQARISKVETGKLKPTIAFVREFAAALGLAQVEAQELENLTGLFLLEFDRWHLSVAGSAPLIQEKVAQIEKKARCIRSVNWSALSGLIQTSEYATHLFHSFKEISTADVQKAVHRRMERQRILRYKSRRFSFVIAEHVFYTSVCPRAVLLSQAERLRDLLQRENVTLRILPQFRSTKVMPITGFDIFDDRLVLVETRDFQVRILDDREVMGYTEDFESLLISSTQSKGDTERLLDQICTQVERSWR